MTLVTGSKRLVSFPGHRLCRAIAVNFASMPGCALLCAGLLASAVMPNTARAHDASLAASPESVCLTHLSGEDAKPPYPPDLLERKDGGTVTVDLIFRKPGQAPEVKLNGAQVDHGFISVVKKHVADLRIPCMQPDSPAVTLRQSYVFTPNDGRKVIASMPEDLADSKRQEQLACMSYTGGKADFYYPKSALRREEQGNYLVKLRFAGPDQAPAVEWLAAAPSSTLKNAVLTSVASMRLPCLQDQALTVEYLFKYRLNGGKRTLLRDMNLAQFLSLASSYSSPAYFDLNSMACPFDLRVSYRRPYAGNRVSELEAADPARKPLLSWLSKVTLKLREEDNINVLGEEFLLTVPCGALDL